MPAKAWGADSLRCCCPLQGLMERFEKKSGGFLGFDLSSLFGQK